MNYLNPLKILRESKNLTQADIAKLLNISRQYYSRYELGEVPLPSKHYKTLAKFYNVSIDYLVGLIEYPKPLNEQAPHISNGMLLSKEELRIIKAVKENENFRNVVFSGLKLLEDKNTYTAPKGRKDI